MSKNIILLSDGTGNSNIKDRGTNVFRLYEAIDFNCDVKQIAFYDDGVGTEKLKPLSLLGSAFGWGLAQNVRSLYKHLVQTYDHEAKDNIYLFGFSRGAFTVRSLAGFIAKKGILNIHHNDRYHTDADLEDAIFQLYEEYRAENTAYLEKLFYQPFIKFFFSFSTIPAEDLITDVPIKFIGVWDTVDAVGLPFDDATEFWNTYIFRFKFPDTILPKTVETACHALAIDDERQSFHPLLWRQDSRIEQVWFPGVHANVGGGYPQRGLSLVTLEWMMNKASDSGLQLIESDRNFVTDKKYVLDKLYNPRSGFGVYYRYKPRNIAQISAKNAIAIPQIHISAFERIAQGAFDYAPRNLPSQFEVVDEQGLCLNSTAIKNTIYPSNPNTLECPLLEENKKFIHSRRLIYYLFSLYSLLTVYWLFHQEIQNEGIFAAIKALISPDILIEKLASLLWHNGLLTLGGVILFLISVYLRVKMSEKIDQFWFNLRQPLKKLL